MVTRTGVGRSLGGAALSALVGAVVALVFYLIQSEESQNQHDETSYTLEMISGDLVAVRDRAEATAEAAEQLLKDASGIDEALRHMINSQPELERRLDERTRALEEALKTGESQANIGSANVQGESYPTVDQDTSSLTDGEGDDEEPPPPPTTEAPRDDPPTEPTQSVPEVTRPSLLGMPPRLADYKRDVREPGCSGVKGSDQWCFYAGQATSFVAWRLNTVNFGGQDVFHNSYPDDDSVVWGHARNWDDAARRLGVRVDSTPAVGAIVQSDGSWAGSLGLLGYVEHVEFSADGTITSFVYSAMNLDSRALGTDPGTWTIRQHQVCPRAGCWPDTQFIHIRDIDESNSP